MNSISRQRVAAASGLLAVGLGAFGAHALRNSFTAGQMHLWETAVFYQFTHTLVLLWLSRENAPSRLTFGAFTVGIVLFSGSLYLLALTGVKWLGFLTPLGGLSFLFGWGKILFG